MEFTAPRGRRLVPTGMSARGQDYCTLRILTSSRRIVASKGFTAFGRAELGEWATADRLIGYLSLVLALREHLDRYPSPDELSRAGLRSLPGPDAPLPAGARGVFIDPAIDRVHATQVSRPGGRRLFVEFTGRERDASFATNVPSAFLQDR